MRRVYRHHRRPACLVLSHAGGGVRRPARRLWEGLQYGYCTPGQILSAVCAVQEVHTGVPSHVTPDVQQTVNSATLTDEEIRERMSGNLCRCAAYPNIVAAVRQVLSIEVRP